jgi:Asp-tRNA(Asn)/Glu-tRNA(Gln) amidotransferase A subunit family amidase
VKELIAVKDLRHSSGSDYFVSPAVTTVDSEIARRLRDAGAIFLGSTRMSELGLSYHTLGAVHPLDATLSPGGSSGGEAIASVANLRPVGMGGDIGGGIRIAAAYCGCVGLRPTPGRVPQVGVGVGTPFIDKTVNARIASYGPIGSSVSDLELILSVISGPCLSDPHSLSSRIYVDGSSKDVIVRSLKIAAFPISFGCEHACVLEAMAAIEKVLPNQLIVKQAKCFTNETILNLTRRLWGIDGGEGIRNLFGSRAISMENQWYFDFVDGAKSHTATEVMALFQEWDRFKQSALVELFSDADAIVMPVTRKGCALPPEECGDFAEITPTMALSLIGVPVVVINSVQVASLPFREDIVFAVSELLERSKITSDVQK